jgi:hypothetical protein
LENNTGTTSKQFRTLIYSSKEVDLELNSRKLSIYFCLETRMDDKIMTNITDRFPENVAHLKCLGTTASTQNLTLGEIKRRI